MKENAPYIAHMLDAIDAVEEYCAVSRETFLSDRKTKDAVLRNFQVIGEAAKKLSEDFRANNREVDWPGIISLRNRVVHEYFSVDFTIVWYIVQEEIPALRAVLEKAARRQQ